MSLSSPSLPPSLSPSLFGFALQVWPPRLRRSGAHMPQSLSLSLSLSALAPSICVHFHLLIRTHHAPALHLLVSSSPLPASCSFPRVPFAVVSVEQHAGCQRCPGVTAHGCGIAAINSSASWCSVRGRDGESQRESNLLSPSRETLQGERRK